MAKHGLFAAGEGEVGAGIDFADPKSPLSRFYLSFGHCLAVAVLAANFIILNYAALWHTDLWAHVRFGDRLLETRTFPEGDPFTPFGAKNTGTFVGPWGSQAIYSLTAKAGAAIAGGDHLRQLAGSADALRFLHALLVTARLALLFWAFLRLTQSSTLAAIGLIVVLAISLGSLGIARPQVFADLAFAGLLVVFSRSQLSIFSIAIATAIMVAWANLHGSFAVGFVLIGGLLIGRWLTGLLSPGPWSTRLTGDSGVRRIFVLMLISLVACAFLNPEGPRIFASTTRMLNHPNVQMMDEWKPIYDLSATGAQVTFAACLLFVFVALLLNRGQFSADAWVLLVLFGVSPLLHQRALVWFISVSIWVAMPYYAAALRKSRPDWFANVADFRKTTVVLAIIVLAIVWSVPVQWTVDGKPMPLTKSLSPATPLELALAVRDPALAPDSTLTKKLRESYPGGRFIGTVFTTEVLGDFFVYEAPSADVFIYSHVHFFTPQQWQNYIDVRNVDAKARAILDTAKVNLIVLAAEQNPALCESLKKDPQWVVLTDETGDTNKLDPRTRLFAALRKQPK